MDNYNTMQAILDKIKAYDRIMLFRHTANDGDCVGATKGFKQVLRTTWPEKEVFLIDEKTSDYLSFLGPEDAPVAEELYRDALGIVLDTGNSARISNQNYKLCRELIKIDHHIPLENYGDLNWVEETRSSTCEMICEMLQYVVPVDHITPVEATAMLAGIILDTRGFTVKTGSRAFEAAAFLRRVGADTVGAKQAFQGSARDYLEKTRLAGNAETYREKFIIATTRSDTDRAVAAQAADNLLDIYGILASFTVFVCDGEVCVSGRSLGQVNVQLILEWMGGGGQTTSAGAQLRGKTITEVEEELRRCIDRYIESSTTQV